MKHTEASLDTPRKIAIVGYSGSGKSSLATALAEKYGMPLLHIDRVFWLPGWQERDRAESRWIIGEFMDTNTSWVIDGNYRHIEYHYGRRMEEADQIIFLDFNRVSCLTRAVWRWVRYHGRSRGSIGAGCPEKIDAEFVKWILRDGRTIQQKARFDVLKKRYADKMTVISSPHQLRAFYIREGLHYTPEKV